MKRFLFGFLTAFTVIFIFGSVSHASYTAPDGNEYTYKLYASTGDYSTRYYTIYTNNKVCRLSGSNWNTFVTLFPSSNSDDKVCATMITSVGSVNGDDGLVKYPTGSLVSTATNQYGFYVWQNGTTVPSRSDNLYDYNTTNSTDDCPIFSTAEECYNYLTTPDIDFETIYYDPTVPTPNFNVYMIRPDAWDNITEETNFFNISWSEYSSYYIQIGYKYSLPNAMKVGVTDGNKVYTPLSYFDSSYYDIYSLEDLHSAISLNATVNSYDFVWQSYSIDDPESWQATVPPWVHNYNNSAYVSARNNWNNKLALCMPLYGNKLEIFARLFYVEDGAVYVGAWRHWNNSYPSEYGEELPQNYQVDNSIPGYQNTNNNTEYQDQTNTITSIGEETGKSNSTTIINNLTPNYPDYPTAVTYNHDNILLQMIQTAKQLPNFFGDFTGFCSSVFAFIPSEIWSVIAFGFLCSIFVMIVKVL